MAENQPREEKRALNRVEAFSDGVFAIAITLLVLDIKVPPVGSVASTNGLVGALVQLWPSLFAFAASFVAILISWVIHHNAFSHLDKVSGVFLYANGFLLMTVVFLPFPTSVLSEYLDTEYTTSAIVFYCFAYVFNSWAWFLFIRSINSPHRLIRDTVSDESYSALKKNNLVAVFIYSCAAILSLWLPYLGLAIVVAAWVIWIRLSFHE